MANLIYAGIGSRQTPKDIRYLMRRIAVALRNMHMTLRSGGAIGADQAFEQGAGDRKEIWEVLPGNKLLIESKKSGNEVHKPNASLLLTAPFHPAWHKCSQGARMLHARNAHILLGANLQTVVDFVVCWTKGGEDVGGTGQGLRIAAHYGIPIHNLHRMDVRENYKRLTDDIDFPH